MDTSGGDSCSYQRFSGKMPSERLGLSDGVKCPDNVELDAAA